MNRNRKKSIDIINENINEVEKLLKESMSFYNEDEFDSRDDETINDDDDDIENDSQLTKSENIESYIDNIRKYSLNGLSALCDTPDSEEYQMLKKIFQMCDKKPEKKDGIMESHRLFGVLKDNKKVVFETQIKDTKDFKNLKTTLFNESILKGFNPSKIRLVSENKIIK